MVGEHCRAESACGGRSKLAPVTMWGGDGLGGTMGRQRASRSRNHVQALNHAERAQSKVVAEDREEPVEEGCGPADFGHDKHNYLEDDEQAIQNSPEGTRGLVRNGTPTTVWTWISG